MSDDQENDKKSKQSAKKDTSELGVLFSTEKIVKAAVEQQYYGIFEIQKALEVASFPALKRALSPLDSPSLRSLRELQGRFDIVSSLKKQMRSPIIEVIETHKQWVNSVSDVVTTAAGPSHAILPTLRQMTRTVEVTGNIMGEMFRFDKFAAVRSPSSDAVVKMISRKKIGSLIEDMHRQQEALVNPSQTIAKALLQAGEIHQHWSLLAKTSFAIGALAASLAPVEPYASAGRLLIYAAQEIAETQRTNAEDDTALRKSVVEEEQEPDLATVLTALEQHSRHVEGMLANTTSPASILALATYLAIALQLVQTFVAVAGYFQQQTNSPHTERDKITPEIAEQLDKTVVEPLRQAVEDTAKRLVGLRIAISKVETRAFVRQAPTRKAKAVSSMFPGQKAVVISEADGWVEVEFADPSSGKTVRGWVYGRLLALATVSLD